MILLVIQYGHAILMLGVILACFLHHLFWLSTAQGPPSPRLGGPKRTTRLRDILTANAWSRQGPQTFWGGLLER